MNKEMAATIAFLSDLLVSLIPSPRQPSPPPPSNTIPMPVQLSTAVSSWKSISAVDQVNRVAFPCLMNANTLFFKSGYYNVQIVPDDDEPEEKLVNRFRRAVLRLGVLQECRRRRYFESSLEKQKRKSREAAKKNRRRRPQPKRLSQSRHENRQKVEREEEEEDAEEGDNWELPEVDIPYTEDL